jgi:hypothetical protein
LQRVGLDLNWTALYILAHVQMTIHIVSSNLRKIRLAPDFPKRNSCIKSLTVSVLRSVCVFVKHSSETDPNSTVAGQLIFSSPIFFKEAYTVFLVGKHEGKRPLGRPRRR